MGPKDLEHSKRRIAIGSDSDFVTSISKHLAQQFQSISAVVYQ